MALTTYPIQRRGQGKIASHLPFPFGPLWRVMGLRLILGFSWLGLSHVFLQLCMKLSRSGSHSHPFHLIFNARSIAWLYINLNYWPSCPTSRLLSFHPLMFLTTMKADATNVTAGYLEPRRQVIRWIIVWWFSFVFKNLKEYLLRLQ